MNKSIPFAIATVIAICSTLSGCTEEQNRKIEKVYAEEPLFRFTREGRLQVLQESIKRIEETLVKIEQHLECLKKSNEGKQ